MDYFFPSHFGEYDFLIFQLIFHHPPKAGSNQEGPKNFLAAPFFESFFTAGAEKRIQKTVQLENCLALLILTWL